MNTGGIARWLGLSALALGWAAGPAAAGDRVRQGAENPPALGAAVARGSFETVHFADRRLAPVKLVRGTAPTGPAAEQPPSREIVSFGTGRAEQVTIVRGGDPFTTPSQAAPVRQASLGGRTGVEKVGFGAAAETVVTVVRGGVALRELFSVGLFAPAGAGELDRIAHAVHGAESSWGRNPRMWRPELDGPQGPMQVSAAAAVDVGGGNRFDIFDNHRIGRAYLAQMFRRYGNWPDALAAYNWGPGNVDQWIAGGRKSERLPLETARYLERVLRDALITTVTARL